MFDSPYKVKLQRGFGVLLVLASWIVSTSEESRGPGYETTNTYEELTQQDSIQNITTLSYPGIIIEGDSIKHDPLPKVTHTFFAKLNTGLFVHGQKNSTPTTPSIETSTGRFPVKEENTVVTFKEENSTLSTQSVIINNDVTTDKTGTIEENGLKDISDQNTTESLERSKLHNREFSHENIFATGQIMEDCPTDICDNFQDSVSDEKVFVREPLMNKPKVTIRMFMPPSDNHFYLSSDTLQDLWQNHINAESTVPLDIVDTSANDLVEYYMPPPDPNFIVPVMTTSPVEMEEEQRFDYTVQPLTLYPQRSPSEMSKNGQKQNGPSFPVDEYSLHIYPTTQPSTTDEVLQRPPLLYSIPYVSKDILQPIPDTTPVNTGQEFPVSPMQASSPVQQVVPLPPQYRIIPQNEPYSYFFSQAQQPVVLNRTLMSLGINNILGKIPPSFIVHSPTNMPTLDLIKAMAGALPDMVHHGPNPHYPDIYAAGGQIKFPPQSNPLVLHSANANSAGVLVTPHSERGDPVVSSDIDEAGDTRLVIKLKAPASTELPAKIGRPDDLGYSEVSMDNGQIIKIRITGDQNAVPSLPQPPTQISTPQTTTQGLINPSVQVITQVPGPRTPAAPVNRFPIRRVPADDRLSVPNLSGIKGQVGQLFNKGGSGNMYGSSNTGNAFNKGNLGNIGGLFDKGGLNNIVNQIGMKIPFNKGSLSNILQQFNKGNIFNKGGIGDITSNLNADNLFNKGNLEGIKEDISGSITQVKSKFQQLVRPFQTKLDSSFDSAITFLQMFFGNVLPGDYYNNVLTILAIIAFLAFAHVRISLMFNSLGQGVSSNLFGKATEVLNSIRESDQVLVIQDLASDVYDSIDRWAEEKFGLSSSWTSNLLFADSLSSFLNIGLTRDSVTEGHANFSKKTLYVPTQNESMAFNTEKLKLNLTSELLREVEGTARLGSTLVDLTWKHGASHSPITGSSCLQRPLCDLNTMSDRKGGLTGMILPLISTGVSWALKPPDDVFSFLDTFRPLWLSNTLGQGEGCRRIQSCNQHT